ncbi:hypothetical protein BJV77DRAFT_1111289 [Russula vinacea]|nr:hypothetical protein BJV77DRAFT_1111289 [Russula vinacea]
MFHGSYAGLLYGYTVDLPLRTPSPKLKVTWIIDLRLRYSPALRAIALQLPTNREPTMCRNHGDHVRPVPPRRRCSQGLLETEACPSLGHRRRKAFPVFQQSSVEPARPCHTSSRWSVSHQGDEMGKGSGGTSPVVNRMQEWRQKAEKREDGGDRRLAACLSFVLHTNTSYVRTTASIRENIPE